MKINRLFLHLSNKRKQKIAGAKSRKPSVLGGSIAVLAASVLSLIAPSSRAATLTWDPTSGDAAITDGSGIWNTVNSNWTSDVGVTNISFTAADDVIFGGGTLGAAGTITLGQAITAQTLTFNAPNGGGAYTITGGTGNFSLTLNAGITANNAANIAANIIIAGGQAWSNTSAGLLNISGNVATSGAGVITLSNTSTGGTTLSGNISGTLGLTMNGATAVYTLSGFNTHTGANTLTAGTLNINNGGNSATNSALGTGTVAINGGTLDNTSGRLVVVQTTGAQTWGGNFAFTGSNFLNLGTGTVAMTADRTVTVNGNTLRVGGIISGAAFKLTKAGTGALTLSGANTFAGGVDLSAGRLNVNSATALGAVGGVGITISGAGTLDNTSGAAITLTANQAVNLNSDFTYGGASSLNLGTGAAALSADRVITVNANSSVIAANALTIGGITSGAFNLTKSGEGQLILSAANTFGGATKTVTLNAGTLTMGNAASLGNAANNLIINGGQLDASAAITTSAYPQNWNGDFRFVGSNAVTLAGAVTLGSTRQVTVNASTLTVSGAIGGATFGLTKAGAGALTLTGNSAAGFNGGVIVNGGALQLNSVTGSLNVTNALTFTGTSSFTYANITTAAANTQVLASAAFSAGDGSLTLNRSVSQNLFLDFSAVPTRTVGGVALLGINGAAAAPANVNNGTAGNIRISFAAQPAGVMGAGYFASSTTAAPTGVYNLAFYDSANGGFVREINYAAPLEGTSVAGGNLLGQTNVNLRTTASATLTANETFASLNINRATAADLVLSTGATASIGSGAAPGVLLRNLGSTTTISGGDGITAGGSQELVIRTDAAADAITLTTPITATTGDLTKSGLGTLAFGTTGITGVAGSNAFTGNFYINAGTVTAVGANAMNSSLAAQTVTLNGGATLNLRSDGDASDALQTVVFGDNYNITGAGTATITVDRQGLGQASGTTFLTTANKTIQLGNLTIGNTTLAATASNGYGLEFNGTSTLSSTPTFNVTGGGVTSTTVSSYIVAGLTLSGKVTGTTTGLGITKSGTGTLDLTSGTNDFVGNITVIGGVLSFNNDSLVTGTNTPLGNVANQITLNGTTATLRASGGTNASPIQTSRTINFANATGTNNVIEVRAGNALQINAPFGLANNAWTKLDAGLLIINADNSTQSGAIALSGGALRIKTSNSIGFSAVTVANTGSSFQLDGSGGDITLNNAFSIGTAAVGTIYNIAGNNTLHGTITGTTGPTLIGDAGSTLNLNNPTAYTGAFALGFAGGGTFNLNGTTGTGTAINLSRFQNGAAPTVNLNVADTTLPATATIGIQGGTLNLGSTSTGLGSLPAAGTGIITVAAGGILNVFDSNGTATVTTRLGGRPVTLQAGALNYTGGGAGLPAPWTSSEVAGALIAAAGGDIVKVTGGTLANPATLTFASLTVNTGSFLSLQGPLDATTNRVIFTAAPTLVNGVIQRAALVNGAAADLVTGTAATPVSIATYTAVAALGDINNTLLATSPGGTFTATNNAQLASGSHQIEGLLGTNTATINALVMSSGVATTLTGTAGALLAVTSGNILIANNTAAIFGNTGSPGNGIILAQGTVPSAIMVNTGSSLEFAGTITSGANTGLQKALGGSLNLTGKQFFTTGTGFFDITGGTVKLSAGNHTLAAQQVNIGMDPTATLDLNGTVLEANAFSSSNLSATVGGGGLVINTSGTQATLVNRGASTFGGQVTGNIFVGHSQTTVLTNDNTYTGGTIITGGTTTLSGFGRLSGTTGITVLGGGLSLDNSPSVLGTLGTNQRLASAPVILNAAFITLTGRTQGASSETLGSTVDLAGGLSNFTVISGASVGVQSNELIIPVLTRSNLDAGFNLNGELANIGSTGTGGRVIISSFGAGATITNNVLPYAAFGGSDLVSYNTSFGLGALNEAGMAGYNQTLAAGGSITTTSTQNIKASGDFNYSFVGGTSAINGLVFNPVTTAGRTLSFTTGTDKLFVTSGAIVTSSAVNRNIGSALNNGSIAAGAAGSANPVERLFFHATGAGITTVNSAIVDNSATSATRIVFDLYNGAQVTLADGTTTSFQPSVTTVLNSNLVTINSTTGLAAGQNISGAGIGSATIAAIIDPTHFTISAPATASGTVTSTIGTVGAVALGTFTPAASATVTLPAGTTTAGLYAGMPITGAAFGSNNYITGITGAQTFTVVVAATATSSTVVAGLTNATGNSYTGGTVLNGWTGNTGNSNSGQVWANATNAIGSGGLIINNALVTAVQGGINATNNVTLNMGAGLTLNGLNTLASITLNANGFSGAGNGGPTLNTGGTLFLTNPTVTASSNNAAIGTGLISGTALDFLGATAVFNVDGVKQNGVVIDPWVSTLNVTALIRNVNGVTKNGDGVLQLGGASIFTGGVNLTAGAISLGASTSVTGYVGNPTIQPFFANGPLGTGTLTIAGGTRILASAANNTAINPVTVTGNFEFDGLNNLALNGFVNLGAATRAISVNVPAVTASMLGVLSSTGGATGITKDGYGTLLLGNDNAISGVTLNNGTLIGQNPLGSVPSPTAPSPFGTGAVTYNGGSLSVRSANGDAIFANAVNVASTVPYVNLDVQGGNTITMGNLNLPMSPNPTVGQVNITGGGTTSTIVFPSTSLTGNGAAGPVRVAGQFQTFNVAASTIAVLSGGGFFNNNEPLNIGAGSLFYGGTNNFVGATTITAGTTTFGAAPKVNSNDAVYGVGNAVNLSGTTTYTILPQRGSAALFTTGVTTGGLSQTATNVAAASGNLLTVGTFGNGITSSFAGYRPNDVAGDRTVHTNAALSTLITFSGYLNITTAGAYSFTAGSDDYASVIIDGQEVARDLGVAGHGVVDSARGGINLAAGQHTITIKNNTGAGTPGGGIRVLYSGADTAAAGTNGGWVAMPASALSYFTGPASAANNYYNAANLDNDLIVAAAGNVTLQGLASDLNSTIKSLTVGAGATVNATNDAAGAAPGGGVSWIGVKGVTNVTAGTAILNPTTAYLYLIGGVNDGGAALTKTGVGSLWLNNSTLFTGAFAINAGTVMLWEGNALSTGGNTVASGASLDLNGVASTATRNITLNGTGSTVGSQIGALYNSAAATASVAGNVTLATSSQIGGFGDITISGAVNTGAAVTLTKTGSDALTLSASNTATLLGPVAITGGVLNNGVLNSGVAGALGVNTIAQNAGAILNLNGNNIALAQVITLNGTSTTNANTNANSFGNLLNSSVSLSGAVRNTVTAGNNMLQLANTANTATVNAPVAMPVSTGIGSNTYATGGDIIFSSSSVISGVGALVKRGGDTIFLRAANTYTGGTTVDAGIVRLDNGGTIQGTAGTITVRTGASLIIDNVTTVVQNRINNATAVPVVGNNKALVLDAGTFTILGNATVAVTETPLIAAAGNATGITANQGQSYINLINNGANVTLSTMGIGTGAAIISANTGTLLITGKGLGNGVAAAANTNVLYSATGTSTVIGQTGAAAAFNKGITPWIIVDNTVLGAGTGTGVSFATLDAAPTTIGLRPLAATEYGDGSTAALTTNANLNLTAARTTATFFTGANVVVNSLTFANAATGLTVVQGSTMSLNSGGVLATQSNTISGPGIIAADTGAAGTYYFNTYGSGTTLTVNAVLGSTQANTGRSGEISKAGAGTVILGGSNFNISTVRVQEGTLKLNNSSAIFYRVATPPSAANQASSSVTVPTLQVNGSGILDLNGFNQALGNLSSINPAGINGVLSGGTIKNDGAGPRLLSVSTTGNNSWAGVIADGTGGINFAKYGNSTFLFLNSNTYTGTTILGGGATGLQDLGALRGTSSVTINQAMLRWDDNSTQSDPWRLGAVPAALNLNGGGFQFNGRFGEQSVANIGAISLASGASQFSTTAATQGSATVQGLSFARSVGATVNFAGSIQGDDGNVKVTGGVTNFNGIVGGWATSSAGNPFTNNGTGDFVAYDPNSGFRSLSDQRTTAGIVYTGTTVTTQPAYGNSAFIAGGNVRMNTNGTITLNAGSNVANSLVIGSAGTSTLTFTNGSDTLFVQSGGILGDGNGQAKIIGGATAPSALVGTANNGFITAGNADGSAGAGNAGYELFLHNLANTMTVNSQIVNNGANAVSLVTSTLTQNAPIIRLNNTNTYTGTTVINSTDLRLNSLVGPAIANSLNITVNGGTENAADSGRQANGRLFFELSNQLNTGATVTLNSGIAGIDLNNFSQTLAQINISNRGGLTGNSAGLGVSVRTGSGTLTLTGGVSATNLFNTANIPFMTGNYSIAAGQHTFLVDALGTAGAEAQIGLAINGTFSGAGGIDKTGTGVLAITGAEFYTGPTNVNTGTLVLGGTDNAGNGTRAFANIPNSQVTVAAPATIDLRGGTGYIGSLNGAGSVTNSVQAITSNGSAGNAGNLFIGLDNSTTGNFSGTFTNFINGANGGTGFILNVTKVGAGIQTVTGDNASVQLVGNGAINNVGTLDLQGGQVVVNGVNGSLSFTAINSSVGGNLIIDDSVNNKVNRLGGAALAGSSSIAGTQTTATTITVGSTVGLTVGMPIFGPGLGLTTITALTATVITTAGSSTNTLAATNQTFSIGNVRTLSLRGGTTTFKEGAALLNEGAAITNGVGTVAATNNGVGNVTFNQGVSLWNFDITGGSAGATVNVNAFTAGVGSLVLNAGATQTLGQVAAGSSSVTVYLNGGMNGQGAGTLSTGAAVNAITGLTGGLFSGVGIRPDILGIDSTGTGLVTYDTFGFRLLAASEYRAFPVQPLVPTFAAVALAGTVNARTTSNVAMTTNTTVNSLRLDALGGITSAGGNVPATASSTQLFNALGTLNTLTVTTGDIIANTGNAGLTGGAVTAAGALMRFNAADITNPTLSSAYLISTNTGDSFVKEGAGALTLNRRLFQGSSTDAGATVVNGGTLNLSSGPNTLTVINGAGLSLVDNLTLNAGTVDLKGNDQTIAGLISTAAFPGDGGTLTNSGALANLNVNSGSVFAGSINGAINLFKTGAGTMALTSTSGYTGLTQVQGGLLTLQDSATLASTTYNLNGGQLRLENRIASGFLSDINPRIPAGSTLNFRSGTIFDLGGPNGNVTNTYAAANILQGQNEIRQDNVPNITQRTMAFTAFTAPTAASGATVLFSQGQSGLGATGAAAGIVLPNTTNATASSVAAGVTLIPMGSTTGLTVSQSVTGTGIVPGTTITAITAGSITLSNAPTAATPTTLAFGPATIGTGFGGIIPWAIAATDQPAMWNPTINPITGLAYGIAVPNVGGTGTAITTSGSTTFTTLNYQQTALASAVSGTNLNEATGTITEAYTVYNTATAPRLMNSFRFSSTTATTLNLNSVGNELVRIESGLWISTGQTLPVNNGRLTVGTASNVAQTFYFWTPANQTNVTGQIVDNGTGALTLSKNGAGTLALTQTQFAGLNATGAATTTTAGSTTVTLAAAPAAGAAPQVGDSIIGAGIPNGATITAVAGAVLTISAPAFATTSAATVGYGASLLETGTNAAVATATLTPALTVTVANGLKYYVGETVTGTGVPAAVTIASIAGNVLTLSSFTTSAALAANQAFGYTGLAGVSTNSAYTGATIVNLGVLALNGAVGSRALNTLNGGLTINNGGSVTMTNAGQIAPTTNLTINGGGVITFAPVITASPATGGINALKSITFNNNGGTTQPQVNFGASGILTVTSGLITSNSDNQGSTPLVGPATGILNFGPVALGTGTVAGNLVTLTDDAAALGFVAGQTVVGTALGIPAATTITSISGNVLTLSAAPTATTGTITTLNQNFGATTAIAPELNVTTTNVNELSTDLQVSAIIANSTVGGAGIGGWSSLVNGGAALKKTGNGILNLSGANTFDNGFQLNAGTLTLGVSTNVVTLTAGVATAFANGPVGTGTLTINGGTVLSDSTARTLNNNLVVAGDFTFGGRQAGNSVTINGTTNLGASVRNITVTNPTVTATLAGQVLGTAGGLTKSGDGILAVTSTLGNTYVGTTSVLGGLLAASGTVVGANTPLGVNTNDLVVGANGTLSISGFAPTVDGINGDPANSTATATAGGLITNIGTAQTLTFGNNNETVATFAGTLTNAANALTLTKVGTGRQNLLGLNTYQGITSITNGTLGVNTLTREPGSQAATTAGVLSTFATGATPAGAIGSQTITLSGADMTAFLANGGGVGSGVQATGVAAGAVVTQISGNNITVSAANTAAVSTVMTYQTNKVTVTAAIAALLAPGMVVGVVAGIAPGTTILSVSGTVVTLSQPATAVAAGPLVFSTPSSVGISSNANANLLIGSATAATLDYIGAGNTTDRGFTMGAGGATVNANGTGALVFTSFTAVVNTIANGSNATLTLGGANTADNTFGQIIPGTNALSLVKADAGRWVLTQANTYTGATNVNAGTLSIANNAGLGTATGVAATGTVVANGATLGLQNNITVGNEKLDINGAGATGVVGALRNESGTNTFGGLVTAVTNATIAAAPTTTLNLTGGVVKDGVTLRMRGGGTINVSTTGISGASANSDLFVEDAGTIINLNVANTYNGPTIIRDGAVLNANVAAAMPTTPRSAVTMDDTGVGGSQLVLGANQVVASLTSTAATSIVSLSNKNLTVGTASGTTTFKGSITGTSGSLTKDGASTQVLSGTANTFTGVTTVNAGTLTVSGSLSGTTGTTVNSTGTLLLNSATTANNIAGPGTMVAVNGTQTTTGSVATAANVNLNGTVAGAGNEATFAVNTAQSGTSHSFGTLTMTGTNNIMDFSSNGGTANTNVSLFFGALDATTMAALAAVTPTVRLTINNWTGTAYLPGTLTDSGNFGGAGALAQDRLIFNTDPGFGNGNLINGISFSGYGAGMQVAFGASQFEIVPVPEPATTALIGSVALCALIGYRERRRFTGIRSRMARK